MADVLLVTIGGNAAGVVAAANQATTALSGVEAAATKSGGVLSSVFASLGQGMGLAAGMAGIQGIAGAMGAVGEAAIGLNSKLEQAKIGFSSMLGSAQLADSFLRDLQQFAAKTPFAFPELVQASQRMLAYGFAANEVKPLLTAVGSAAAGMGAGSEGVDRITRALGQMKAATVVQKGELSQLTEVGVPAFEILANAIGKTSAQTIKLVEQGKISSDVFINAFQEWSNAKYGDMMAQQAKTFEGAMSTIQDVVGMTVANAFQPFYQAISAGAVTLSEFLQGDNFQSWAVALQVGFEGAITWVGSFLSSLAPIGEAISTAFGQFTSGDFAAGFATIGTAIQTALGTVVQSIQAFATEMFGAGVNLIGELASGILDAGSSLLSSAVESVAEIIASFLVGSSPPAAGPLANITQGGANTMAAWGEGALGAVDAAVSPVVAAVAGNLDQLKTAGDGADAAIRNIGRSLQDLESKSRDIKYAAEDIKRAYDDQIKSLDDQIKSIEKAGDATRDRQKLEMSLEEQLLRQAEIQAMGDPVLRAQLRTRMDALKTQQAERKNSEALADAEKALGGSRKEQLKDQQESLRLNQQEADLRERLSKAKDPEDRKRIQTQLDELAIRRQINSEDSKDRQEAAQRRMADAEAKKEELTLQGQLDAMTDKAALAEVKAQQEALRARKEQLDNAEKVAKIERDMATGPLKEERERLQQERDGLLKPLQQQLEIMSRQKDSLNEQRQAQQQIKTDIAAATKEVKEQAKAQQEAAAAVKKTAEAYTPDKVAEAAVAKAREAGAKLAAGIGEGFSTWIQANFLGVAAGALGAVFGGSKGAAIGAAVAGPLGGIIGFAIGTAIGGIGSAQLAGQLQDKIEAIIGKPLLDAVRTKAEAIITGVREAFDKMAPSIQESLQKAGDAWRTVGQVFGEGWEPSEVIDPTVNAIGKIALTIRDVVIPKVTELIVEIGKLASVDMAGITTPWDGLGRIVSAAVTKIGESVKKLEEQAAKAAESTDKSTKEINDFWTGAQGITDTSTGGITGAMWRFYDSFLDALKRINTDGAATYNDFWAGGGGVQATTDAATASVLETIGGWIDLFTGAVVRINTEGREPYEQFWQDAQGTTMEGTSAIMVVIQKWNDDTTLAFTTWVTTSLASFATWATDLTTMFTTWVADSLAAFKVWGDDTTLTFTTWITDTLAAWKKWGEDALAGFTTWVEDVTKVISDGWDTMWARAGEAWDSLWALVNQKGADILGALVNQVQPWIDTGKLMGEGLVKAVGDALANLAETVLGPIKRAIDSAKGLLNFGGVTSGGSSAPGGPIDNSSRESFVRTAYPHALQAAGGDAKLAQQLLATAISENGAVGTGRSLGEMGFNVGGIQGVEGTAGSFTALDAGRPRKFAAYNNLTEGFDAVLNLIKTSPRYKDAYARYQQSGDVDQLWSEMNQAGYAEDPAWSTKVGRIRAGQVSPVTASLPAMPRGGVQGAPGSGLQTIQQTQREWSQNAQDAGAICGPYLAALFSDAVGRPPTPQEARDIAAAMDVYSGYGFKSASQFDEYATRVIQTMNPGSSMRVTQTPVGRASDAASIAQQSLAAGSPLVGFNTPNHYFGATGFDAATGLFDVGGTGRSIPGGSSQMSIAQISELGGGITNVITLVGQLGDALIDTGATGGQALDGLTTVVADSAGNITTTVTDLAGNVVEQYTTMGADVAAQAVTMGESVLTSVTDLGDGIMTITTDSAGNMVATITDMAGNVVNTYTQLGAGVTEQATAMATSVTDSVTQTGTRMIEETTNAAGVTVARYQEMNGEIVTIVTDQNGKVVADFTLTGEKIGAVTDNTGTKLVSSTTTSLGVTTEIWREKNGEIVTIVTDASGKVVEQFTSIGTAAEATIAPLGLLAEALVIETPDYGGIVEQFENVTDAAKDAEKAAKKTMDAIGDLDKDYGGDAPGERGFKGERALGGPVSKDGRYLVGERGPELFTPTGSGYVTANNRLGGDFDYARLAREFVSMGAGQQLNLTINSSAEREPLMQDVAILMAMARGRG